jgi:hypothetical protein
MKCFATLKKNQARVKSMKLCNRRQTYTKNFSSTIPRPTTTECKCRIQGLNVLKTYSVLVNEKDLPKLQEPE